MVSLDRSATGLLDQSEPIAPRVLDTRSSGFVHALELTPLRRWERAIGALCAGLLAFVASGPISDNSLLTHIATGRIQASGGLPHTNPFLTSSSDFPVPSWWWSAALGWLERFSGLGAVRLFTVLVAALVGWLVVRAARPAGAPCEPAAGALTQLLPAAVVLAVLVPWMNGRPQLGGFLLLAAALLFWRERQSPWWMVPLFAVWVNVHGTWLYAVVVLGVLWVAEVIDDREWHIERLSSLAAVVGGIFLGGLAYPERFRLVRLPTEQLGSTQARAVMRVYQEWKPAALSSPWLWVFLVLGGLALYGAVSAVLNPPEGRPRRFGTLLAVLILCGMGLSALRLLPVAAIPLAGFAAAGVARLSQLEIPPAPVRIVMAVSGVLLLVGAGVRAWTPPHEDLSRYPVTEVDWLNERGLVANDDISLIENDWVGNYLEYRFGEEANVWVDDRPSARTMIDYVRLRGLSDGWQVAFDRADPDVVLWQSDDPLPGELAKRPEWHTALTTDHFRVLCRARIAPRCD